MRRVADWFTPERRQAIQLWFGSLAPLAIMFGYGTEGMWEQWLVIGGAVLQAVSSGLSLVNVRDVNKAWQIVRGAVDSARGFRGQGSAARSCSCGDRSPEGSAHRQRPVI
jgi:hypothetical protein